MTARRRHLRAVPEPAPASAARARVVLDWRDSEHWGTEKPCRYCNEPTHLRDSKGKSAHKVCAEDAIATQAAEAAEAYERERLH